MKPQTKRHILIALLAVTGLATLGIIASLLLSDSFHRGIGSAFLAGMGIGFLVLVSFAATTSLDHPFWKYPALAGMAVAAFTMLLHPVVVIGESFHSSYDNPVARFFMRLDGTGFLLTGLLCLAAFVMTPNIKFLGRLLQLTVTVFYCLIFLFFQFLIWELYKPFENRLHGLDDLIGMFVVAIVFLAIAGTIAVFILNKFFGIKVKNPVTYSSTTLHLQCPRCRTFQDLSEGESACLSCKLKFKIEVEEPVCPKCGYNLHMLTSPRCPECGTVFLKEPEASSQK